MKYRLKKGALEDSIFFSESKVYELLKSDDVDGGAPYMMKDDLYKKDGEFHYIDYEFLNENFEEVEDE